MIPPQFRRGSANRPARRPHPRPACWASLDLTVPAIVGISVARDGFEPILKPHAPAVQPQLTRAASAFIGLANKSER